ncbi:metallophosphoesterase family protein [Nitratiruptor sp. YY09-18]|uniref:metallophosphoesterase family protein n=1 Tax=Nitratiruptor sp. YY09-18 TaxID=2724901 RepID=UPI001916953E|nr:metallophosphoesterase family protein [Nitratiruptor sp. YY09-18]
MKIGVISDTHNKLENTQEIVAQMQQENIAYLIHAGDIGQNVLDFLATLPLKTIAVYGNTDTSLYNSNPQKVILQKQPYYFKIGNTTFKLMHQPYFLTPDSDVVIYGHLHKFSCERAKSLFINPGEVCAREKPRIEGALLDLSTKEVTYIYKEKEWHKQKVCA